MIYYISIDPAMKDMGVGILSTGIFDTYSCKITEFGSVLDKYHIKKDDKVYLFMEKQTGKWSRNKITQSAACSIERHIKMLFPRRNKIFKYTSAQWRMGLFNRPNSDDNKQVSLDFVSDYGIKVDNHNIAEAICVLIWGMREVGKENLLKERINE